MMWTTTIDSPVGLLHCFATRDGLRALVWSEPHASHGVHDQATVDPRQPTLAALRQQLAEYFARTRRSFDLPLDPVGTEFQLAAWEALRAIPYGQTRSYGEQAHAIGRPKAVRAVGAANGRNPISIVVPCHRVIGASGSLTGFGGGLPAKRYLLELESGVQSLAIGVD